MPRSLADQHEKIAVLTTKPVNPEAPTVAELNAGITDAALRILQSDWQFGPTDSESFNDKAVGDAGNAEAFGASNWQAGMTVFRYFDAGTKNASLTEDALFAATKVKGSRVWVYARRNGKLETEAFAANDELRFGAEILTDNPQPPSDMGGYVKTRIPMRVQRGFPEIKVAAP